MDYEEVLKHLCALPGPSGFEGPVAPAAAELLRPLVDEVREMCIRDRSGALSIVFWDFCPFASIKHDCIGQVLIGR